MSTAVAPNGKKQTDSPLTLANSFLVQRVKHIEEVLPDFMKGQGDRLVKRAMLTMSRNSRLMECSLESIFHAVLGAAELGLAIDGRLGHAVPYKNKRGNNWVMEAQFQPDYKGIVAVARRSKTIKDCYAEVVCKGDVFEHGERGDKQHLLHTYEIDAERTQVRGAYAKIMFADGSWRYLLMSYDELMKIKKRSKSKDREGNLTGPWVTDEWEMFKKTVIKRALKTYADTDMMLAKAIEHDEPDDEPIEGTFKDSSALPQGRVKHLTSQKAVPAAFEQPKGEEVIEMPGEGEPQQLQQQETVERPAWVNTSVNLIRACGKFGLLMSMADTLIKEYKAAPQPDQEEWYPHLFSVWHEQTKQIEIKESEAPLLMAKLKQFPVESMK